MLPALTIIELYLVPGQRMKQLPLSLLFSDFVRLRRDLISKIGSLITSISSSNC